MAYIQVTGVYSELANYMIFAKRVTTASLALLFPLFSVSQAAVPKGRLLSTIGE